MPSTRRPRSSWRTSAAWRCSWWREAGIGLAEYSPLEVKVSVVGYGRAEKRQVQMMVKALLHLAAPVESEDASDALAVAICDVTRQAASLRLGWVAGETR